MEEQICYGTAMLGYDSVINSRLGVPAEHALDLARTKSSVLQTVYSGRLLNTILTAYLWKGSPHSYATKVFFQCAQDKHYLRQADLDIVVNEAHEP